MNLRKLGVLALTLMLPLAACDDGTAVEEAGTFTLLLTDDPGFEKVWITIEEIELIGDGGVVNLFPGDLDPVPDPGPVDLLALSNQVLPLVQDVPVGPGTFSQLRIVVSEACVDDGENVYSSSVEYTHCGTRDGPLQIPSYRTSGFKIQLPGGSMEFEGGRSIVIVDFMVPESFGHVAGSSGRMVLRPHVKATRVELSGTLLVSLDAMDEAFAPLDGLDPSLDPPASLGEFQAQLWVQGESDWVMDGLPVTFTDDGSNPGDVAEDGIYTAFFGYLVPGPHRVELLVPPREGATDPPFSFDVDGDNPVELTIDDSEDDTAEFTVKCAYAFGADSPCAES